jgi:hypothetical protein
LVCNLKNYDDNDNDNYSDDDDDDDNDAIDNIYLDGINSSVI